jgi:GTP diphosphokinase / guanosine-3',5'-bis(diphosphate) 3'-diphosphatase
MLEQAIRIAVEIHAGQKDLSGAPYILHVLRVMMQMEDEIEQTIAVLHDAIEDYGPRAIIKMWEADIPNEVIEVLMLLSRSTEQSYDSYIKPIMTDIRAMRVKLSDLNDNTDPHRITTLINQGVDPGIVWARVHKYKAAMDRIRKELG